MSGEVLVDTNVLVYAYDRSEPDKQRQALAVLEAARGVLAHSFSFWDAQIWATARLNQISVVFSEDFSVGASVEGIRFTNPFGPEFRLREIVS